MDEKTKILGSAKLYVRGTDLFCSDHIDVTDPECYGVATPLNKSVVVGVTIGFNHKTKRKNETEKHYLRNDVCSRTRFLLR